MLTLILFVVVLSFLVFIHEFGHFTAARRLGVHVEEFGFGFPPRLFGIKRGATIYSLNAIPFGGFVRLKGENGDQAQDPDSFSAAPLPRRAIIIVAGVLMNFVLTIVLLTFSLMAGLPTPAAQTLPGAKVKDIRVTVTALTETGPAARAGLKPGDVIAEANGQRIRTDAELRSIIEGSLSSPLNLTYQRSDLTHEATLLPEDLDASGKGKIGVGLETYATASYPPHWALANGVRLTVELAWKIVVSFTGFLKDLVVHQQVSPDVAGPVGIAVIIGQVAELGIFALLQFVALLSLSLAVINVLPFPALDGGRLLFLGIEAVRGGRPVNRRIEAWIHNIGFIVLITFILLVSVQDVQRFSIGAKIRDSVRSIFQR